jgi:hypothetical protein
LLLNSHNSRLEDNAGTGPESELLKMISFPSWLSPRVRKVSAVSFPSDSGIEPLRRLLLRSRASKEERTPSSPSEDGI